MASMGALIEFLGLLHDESNFGQFRIRTHDLSQYLRLDNSALRALNVFPDAAQTGKNMSVYGLCNHCRTPQGQRLLGQWLKQPLINIHEIRKWLHSPFQSWEHSSLSVHRQEAYLGRRLFGRSAA